MDAWRYNVFTRDMIMKTQLEAEKGTKAFEIDENFGSNVYSTDGWMSN
jgi:hypothetical protein